MVSEINAGLGQECQQIGQIQSYLKIFCDMTSISGTYGR